MVIIVGTPVIPQDSGSLEYDIFKRCGTTSIKVELANMQHFVNNYGWTHYAEIISPI